jgi:hypothetical protein
MAEGSTKRDIQASVGDRMADGTIYAGVSPDTGRPMYTTPADESGLHEQYEAKKHAYRMDAHGHRDWRVPSKGELKVLFDNRAAIGGFTATGASTPEAVGTARVGACPMSSKTSVFRQGG